MQAGDNAVLSCETDSLPEPAVTWFKDRQPLALAQRTQVLQSGQRLEILATQVSRGHVTPSLGGLGGTGGRVQGCLLLDLGRSREHWEATGSEVRASPGSAWLWDALEQSGPRPASVSPGSRASWILLAGRLRLRSLSRPLPPWCGADTLRRLLCDWAFLRKCTWGSSCPLQPCPCPPLAS